LEAAALKRLGGVSIGRSYCKHEKYNLYTLYTCKLSLGFRSPLCIAEVLQKSIPFKDLEVNGLDLR